MNNFISLFLCKTIKINSHKEDNNRKKRLILTIILFKFILKFAWILIVYKSVNLKYREDNVNEQ